MVRKTSRKLSVSKRFIGLSALAIVMVGSLVGSFVLLRPGSPPPEAEAIQKGPGLLAHSITMFVLGCLCLFGGLVSYCLVLLTRCVTFDFGRPFFPGFKKKLFVANIIVIFLLAIGSGFLLSMVTTPVLVGVGVPFSISFVAPVFVGVVLVQCIFIWVNLWRPVIRSATENRLAACGLTEEKMGSGLLVGLSDPEKSSLKKLGLVEEDVGMLWFEPHRVVYRGDTAGFEIRRPHLLQVERVADSGSMAAYAGAVHVIIRHRREDGTEGRVRIHTLDDWTLRGAARSLDSVAERFSAWHEAPSPADGDAPQSPAS